MPVFAFSNSFDVSSPTLCVRSSCVCFRMEKNVSIRWFHKNFLFLVFKERDVFIYQIHGRACILHASLSLFPHSVPSPDLFHVVGVINTWRSAIFFLHRNGIGSKCLSLCWISMADSWCWSWCPGASVLHSFITWPSLSFLLKSLCFFLSSYVLFHHTEDVYLLCSLL